VCGDTMSQDDNSIANRDPAPQALAGLRVIDLSPNRVGAQVSQLFADYGADVVWVEPPGGSPMRRQPAYPFWGRGKRSVVIDLQTQAGRDALRTLLQTADVLIDTFRPGKLATLGFDEAGLRAINPRLVHTSITGFGTVGPYAGLQGYEGIVAAKLGIFQAFHRMIPGDRPAFVNVPWCSFPASHTALHGTLAALIEREHSGVGQRVEASLAQAFTALDTWGWYEQYIERKWPGAYTRTANYDIDEIPASPFAYFLLIALTKDGHWLQFAQVAPRLFVALMKELGLEWMLTDPEWAGIPMFPDRQRRLALWSTMLEVANSKTIAEWQEIFETNPDVFAEEFRQGTAVLDHPQMLHDGTTISLADADRGAVRQPGPLAVLTKSPADVTRSAPRLGEHQWLVDQLTPADAVQPLAADIGSADSSGTAPVGLPLAGVTVLEFAVQYAAPYGATLLTELGARVIKVESLQGDPIRSIVPFPETGGAKVMAGKESVALDLATPEGLAIAHQLVESADIVMQGFRAGVADRIGVGYQTLRAIKPDLVYLNAMGYGLGGPNGHRPAYAPSIGAAAGVARGNVGNLVEERSGMSLDEIRHGSFLLTVGALTTNAQADGFAALGVATAMLLGLLARERGAGGQEMTTSMVNTNAHAMSAHVVDYPGSHGEPQPDGAMRGLSALYRTYDTTDGWVFLAAGTDKEWQRLIGVGSFAGLGGDRRFADVASRSANDDVLAAELGSIFASGRKAAWERELRAVDVACVAVTTTTIEEALWGDDLGGSSDYIVEVDHPVFERHPRMAPLIRFSRSTTQAGAAGLLGSHTDAVLAEIGYTPAAITDLRHRNIVG
jgi:crotonobetainyl-CoA:carnitine CoA-transferase CaiB-like acyl-CoA transferase